MGAGAGEEDPEHPASLVRILDLLETPLVRAFARAVLHRVPATQLALADPAATAGAVIDSFRYVDTRAPREVRVRVYDPDVALDGGHPLGSVVEVSCEDRQFIVSSVTEELRRLGHKVVRELHPVFGCERYEGGALVAVLPARPATWRESFVQVELGDRVADDARPALVAALEAVLADVFSATGDYGAMRARLEEAAASARASAGRFPADEAAEAGDLLEWLLEGNFVLAGCCRFLGREGVVGGALGILSRPDVALRRRDPAAGPPVLLRIVRTREVSTAHRQVPLHCIDLMEGEDAVFRVVGVFTGKANAEPAAVTPVLRFKLRRILELEDVVERSQDEAALVSLFQALPKDQLFETDVASLRRLLVELLTAEDEHDVRVLVRVDALNETVSALLSIPGELYNPALRHRIERFLLAQLDGDRVDVDVSLGDRPEALVRFVVHVPGPPPDQPLDALERELRLLCRTWDQQVVAALEASDGDLGARRAQTWAGWFPEAYRDAVSPESAVGDVVHLEELFGGEDGIKIVLSAGRDGPPARLKVFTVGAGVELSGFLPLLESLGLWAVEDRPYALGGEEALAHLHDFGVKDPSGSLDVDRDGLRLAAAALALWQGRADVDSLNRLVLRAGMEWDDVAVLRAYRRYRSQVGTTFTTAYVDDVLVDNAAISAGLVELFAALFDPGRSAGPEVVAELRQRVSDGCDAVARLDHDRILRGVPRPGRRHPAHQPVRRRPRRPPGAQAGQRSGAGDAPAGAISGDLRARAGGGGRPPALGPGSPRRYPLERPRR